MSLTSGWRIAVCVAALVAATESPAYPNCEDDPSIAATLLAQRITGGELDMVYDNYFVRALQKQMERASFAELARTVGPADAQGARPILMKPVVREVDQLAVKNFTRLSGAAAGVSIGVVRSRSSPVVDLQMTLQCQDGHWKLAGIDVTNQARGPRREARGKDGDE
jgi:hypothetical protein